MFSALNITVEKQAVSFGAILDLRLLQKKKQIIQWNRKRTIIG